MQDKHTSTLIRKKWRKSKQWRCCAKQIPGNLTKPMDGFSCGQAQFYRNRNKMVFAKQEIKDLLQHKKSVY